MSETESASLSSWRDSDVYDTTDEKNSNFETTCTDMPGDGRNDLDTSSNRVTVNSYKTRIMSRQPKLKDKKTALLQGNSHTELNNCYSIEGTILSTINIFKESGVVKHFNINEMTLLNWLTVVKESCDNNHPYHNWSHAFSVTQCVSTVISCDRFRRRLTSVDKLVMLVAAICHELCYSSDTTTVSSPQAIDAVIDLYSTPWDDFIHMEYFIQTLYDHQGCNIFESLSADEELDFMDMISSSMAATDLDIASQRCKVFTTLIDEKLFDWFNSTHRELFRSMTLTACSLSGLAKSWNIHLSECQAVLKNVTFLKIPENPEMTLTKTLCNIVQLFLELFKYLSLLHDGFQHLYNGAVKNHNKWLHIIARGKLQLTSEDLNITSKNSTMLPDHRDIVSSCKCSSCTDITTTNTQQCQSLDDSALDTDIRVPRQSSNNQDKGEKSDEPHHQQTSAVEQLVNNEGVASSNTAKSCHKSDCEVTLTHNREPRKNNIILKILRKFMKPNLSNLKKAHQDSDGNTKPGSWRKQHDTQGQHALTTPTDVEVDLEVTAQKPKHASKHKRSNIKTILRRLFRLKKSSSLKPHSQ